MINYLEIAALIILVFVGWNRPHRLILFFIYSYPYIAGNSVFGIEPPKFIPSQSIAFAILIVGLFRWNFLFKTEKLARTTLFLLVYMVLVTAIGLLYVNQDYLSSWSQPPPVRAIRAQLKEVLFWLLPLFSLYMVLAANKSIEFGRAIIYAGIFYCGLGILQLMVNIATGIDLFPIIRGEGVLQSVVGSGLDGRITSICGEPRYLSALAAMWLVIIVLFGKQLLFSNYSRVISGSLFVATIILSGSRTGFYSVIIIFMTIFLIQATGRATIISWRKSIVYSFFGLFLVSFLFANSSAITQRSFSKQKDAYFGKQIEIGPVSISIEPQDYLTLAAFIEEPQAIIIGLGAGLAQYYYNPLSDLGIVTNFGGYDAIDSQRPNFSVIHLVTSFGLVGLLLQFYLYRQLSNSCITRCKYEFVKQIPWLLTILWVLVQVMKLNDLYGQVSMFVIAAIYHSNTPEYTASNEAVQE